MFDADIISGTKCSVHMRKAGGHHATRSLFVNKKSFKDFDDLEKIIKNCIADKKKLRSLWDRIDFNGNNIVSLAEIDKLVVEAYPLLNHKPALMRAYKAAIHDDGERDHDWVHKKEFKALLGYLFYFNKVWWLFESADNDHDRRMTIDEFKMLLCSCGSPVNEQEARQQFSAIDRNGGGKILFTEFCRWFTHKKC